VECWKGFPVRCICGGLVHAQFVKESWQNVVDLAYACDICGENFIFPGQRPKRKYQPVKRRRFNNKPR
jgi:hypothetical protein